MTDAQRRLMQARNNLRSKLIDPAQELLDASDAIIAEHQRKASDAQNALETLRPVWAQGWSNDSIAAQASATALAELWQALGVVDQTAAMAKIRELVQ